jgi:hypothetical protein
LQVHAFSIGVKFTLLLVKLASTGTAKAAEVANELIPTAMAAVSNMAFISFLSIWRVKYRQGCESARRAVSKAIPRGRAIRT